MKPLYPESRLKPRDYAIIEAITEGCTNQEMAKRIGQTENVAKNYLKRIYDVLGFSNRVELAMWWIKQKHDKTYGRS